MFDGKLRILHHYVDGFTCEGFSQPESILSRVNGEWYFRQNTSSKCAKSGVLVQGVDYDDVIHRATYQGKLFVPPKPYIVVASEDPNLPDVDLIDGVCADINGLCSLRAATDQSVPTALTAAVLVKVTAGLYKLTDRLQLETIFRNSNEIKIQGEDPLTTIIDGDSKTSHMYIKSNSSSPNTFENLTFRNGAPYLVQVD